MIRATKNQLENLNNSHQDLENCKRVLCVCSAGMLRSASMAIVFAQNFGYNTRSAGTEDYALIPVTEALVRWADIIVCAEPLHRQRILSDISYDEVLGEAVVFFEETERKIIVLNLPDDFGYMDQTLVRLISERYKATMK